MRSLRQNKKGQFVVIAALIIIIFTLSLVLTISKISLTRQEMRYEPVQELVLGIVSDFDRCLSHALSIATQAYNESGSLEEAIAAGNDFIAKWLNSTLAFYSSLGLEIDINASEYGATDVFWNLNWGARSSVSYAYTRLSLNINAYGFKGWTSYSIKSVWLSITNLTISVDRDNPNESIMILTFQVMERERERVEPVLGLTPENLQIKVDSPEAQDMPVNIENQTYLGNGKYRVFCRTNSTAIISVTITLTTPEDNIMVSAHTSGEWSILYLSGRGSSYGSGFCEFCHFFCDFCQSFGGDLCRIFCSYCDRYCGASGEERLVSASQLNPYIECGYVKSLLSYFHDTITIKSDQTVKNITLRPNIIVILFLEPLWGRPLRKLRFINVELGFQYDGTYYKIGNTTLTEIAGTLRPYVLTIDSTQGQYLEDYGVRVVPAGSILILKIQGVFKFGFDAIKLYYGLNTPSQIILQ